MDFLLSNQTLEIAEKDYFSASSICLGSLSRLKHLDAGVFYDITGFANYIIASKN